MAETEPKKQIRAVLVSPPLPWLANIGSALAHGDELDTYLTTIVESLDGWQSYAVNVPFIGTKLARELSRRALPVGVNPRLVTSAAAIEEVAQIAMSRMPKAVARVTQSVRHRIVFRRNRILSKAAASMLSNSNVIIAPFGTALEAFESVRADGVMKVLDYPIAHHRYSHRLMSSEAERIPEFAGTLQWRNFPKALERKLDKECELADLILTGSAFARDSFIEEGVSPSKVLAIPYGVDSGKFQPRGPQTIDEVFRVLFVGSIGQRKGISYLLDGYSRFAKSNTELMLVGNYVGDGRAFRPYHRVYTHVPHAPHSMMPEIFSAGSVFVFPSLLEGLGIVVLEAMAAGLPVIVTANGPGHVVRDGVDGYVVPAGDSEAIQNRLEQLYDDLPLRNRMALSARERAMEFSWDNHSRKVIDALRLGLGDFDKSAVRPSGDGYPAEAP